MEGKSRSRWDALKHGLLAKAVIIERGEGQEQCEDFEALLQALQEDLAPEGALEQMLVEKIAVDYWRLRRLLASETGRIRSQVDTLETDERTRVRSRERLHDLLSDAEGEARSQVHRTRGPTLV